MTPQRWRQIERLYHAARELNESQRTAFLDAACAEDEVLRREVAVLLAADEQAESGSFLAQPALAVEAAELADEKTFWQAGQQFSHYQILSKLGAGGMGEVYLARDTKLERQIALKVLPSQFTADADRLQRFVREAKAASALNHPNIITIYEIGEVGATHFIAEEFIAGVTLRQRLAEGKLKLHAALAVAQQIAEALATAHQAGIIHRDIKPENVMLRPDGLVKVLDFGLAKLTERHGDGELASDSAAPSLSLSSSTTPGMLLGTPRYMSPEQARGLKVDARSDIFSFGAVLYELLSGQPPFSGASLADLFAAILDRAPPPLAQFTAAPPELQHIVSRMLAKDCAQRYQTVGEMQLALQSFNRHLDAGELETLREERPAGATLNHPQAATDSLAKRLTTSLTRPAQISPLLLLAGLAVIGIAGWLLWPRTQPASVPRELRFETLFAKKGQDGELLKRSRFSPDGKLIAYAAPGAEADDGNNIWVMQISGRQPRQLTTGNWRDRSPVWSPDGEQIAFASDRGAQFGIWTIPFFGGAPTLLKSLEATGTAVQSSPLWLKGWARDGAAIYYEWNHNFFRLELATKEVTQLTRFDPATQFVQDFALSPDEQEVAYIDSLGGQADVWRVALRGGAPQRVTNDVAGERYPVWQPDGQHLLFSSARGGKQQIYRVEIAGGEPLPVTAGDYQEVISDVSAHRFLCYSARDESDIFAVQLAGGAERRITEDLGAEFWSSVSPDGRTLAYQALQGERFVWDYRKSLLTTRPLNAGPTASQLAPQLTTRLAADAFEARWSPDGEQLAFLRYLEFRQRSTTSSP